MKYKRVNCRGVIVHSIGIILTLASLLNHLFWPFTSKIIHFATALSFNRTISAPQSIMAANDIAINIGPVCWLVDITHTYEKSDKGYHSSHIQVMRFIMPLRRKKLQNILVSRSIAKFFEI